MLETLYNLFGYNAIFFMTINQHTNISYLPNILQGISSVFFIGNFAALYLISCMYFYYKAIKSDNPTIYFEFIYYELTRIGICYALFGIIFAALKFSINLPRPFCSLQTTEFITIANTSAERCLSSFPSAHTGLGILVAYFIWTYIGRISRLLICTLVLLVALSRITLAMHYPTDIIYSALVTYLIIIISNILYKLLKKPIITPIKQLIVRLLFNE